MKVVVMIAFFMVVANLATSEGWENQYLADTGGAHMIRIEKVESQQTEAYIANPDPNRMLLAIGCRSGVTDVPKQISYMRIANGKPFLSSKVELTAVFDGDENIQLGWFDYTGGGYTGSLTPQVLVRFILHDSIAIDAKDLSFTVEFSLENASTAIQKIKCLELAQ